MTISTPPATPYDRLLARWQEAQLLSSTGSLLGWDQETFMPAGGLGHRARQLSQLASLAHGIATSPEIGEWLAACEADRETMADPDRAANVRHIRHDYDRETKLPAALVAEFATATSLGQHEWAEARKANDFARFRPHLEKLVSLLRAKAECYGWDRAKGEAWDALADSYEPGCTAAHVASVFSPLRTRLAKLVGELLAAPRKPDGAFNDFPVPIESQERLGRMVARRFGFDFGRGRLDRSTHPFCGGACSQDVRMTSRYRERCVNDGLGSVMHETGHGIYEQGLPYGRFGTPLGESVSLGIHESQSRLWENQVGRSKPFWTWLRGELPDHCGPEVSGFTVDSLYAAANEVEAGFIRVDADEATYNLHIMVRFEIERAVLRGELEAGDIPATWNRLYKDFLGLTVPDDRQGCLQDIHWSMGAMGYFPTYTLGNLYAAQFFEAALERHPSLPEEFAHGEFGTLKTWLNENIHTHGKRYTPTELCQRITGKPLSADPLLRHLESKLKPLHGL
jgi:carboxypeptidase Taq